LRVTDENGLVGETNRLVQPSLVVVDVKSNIPGTSILIEDEPITIPKKVWGWQEQDIHLVIENNPPYVFRSWSDGLEDPVRVVTLNYSDPVLEAIFCVDDGGNCLVGGEEQACCIGACNSDGICSVPVELPPLDVQTTASPTVIPMDGTPVSNLVAPTVSPPTSDLDATSTTHTSPPTPVRSNDTAKNIATDAK